MHKRWGIYGGSFDPLHNAHLMVAQCALDKLALEKVVLIPAGNPPHKGGSAYAAARDRLQMARLGVAGRAGMCVSDMEIAHDGPDYTVLTLQRLHEAHADVQLTFLVGGDSLLNLDKWYQYRRLFDYAQLAAVYRPGATAGEYRAQKDKLCLDTGGVIHLLECPGMDLSSTMVRSRISRGESLDGLVPPAVAQY
ncbi:MAG: nicotinate-nucleotide adenylyltransferase, partial [Eubacteriales bacterium]|nr:nicotinate-nucleotide adenylyltransferase [Eubacteriales bacterium]